MEHIKISFSDEIIQRSVPLRIVNLRFSNLHIFSECPVLDAEFTGAINEALHAYTIESLSNDLVIKDIRNLFKSFGTDPTRWRPSSEALLRRALKLKELYRINTIVDINNIVSIKFRLPIGLYDCKQVKGGITIGIGKPGESFIGLTGREYNTEGKPVVRDSLGVIGSPIVDSDRTKITEQTGDLLAIIFSNSTGQPGVASRAAEHFTELVKKVHPESELTEIEEIG